jgi:peptide-N4-(N-acetyl-beta-glucosaminyl)asparagine amidase
MRHVTDWTDHVWVEIFLPSQNRWIHCDPCENSFDNPLLYEAGWGKKLTYVIAVSHDDIQDVTWRYSDRKNQRELVSRRLLVPESWLVSAIIRLRKQAQAKVVPARKEILQERLIKELVEFISPTKPTADSELRGRISGTLEWRQARHETGKDARVEGCEWLIFGKMFTLSYNCAEDTYTHQDFCKERGWGKTIGWQAGVFRSQDIFRKEERDWNMAYLARNPNNPLGSLSWKFVSGWDNLKFEKIVLTLESSIFHDSASVSLEISTSSGATFEVPRACCSSGKWNWEFRNFEGACSWVVISCRLEGGDGQLAWQHAQLFRQSTTFKGNSDSNKEKDPFHIQIHLSEIEE